MALKVVTDYHVGWKLQDNLGGIGVRLGASQNFHNVPLSNVGEFQALVTVLQGSKPVYYDTVKKLFTTKTP